MESRKAQMILKKHLIVPAGAQNVSDCGMVIAYACLKFGIYLKRFVSVSSLCRGKIAILLSFEYYLCILQFHIYVCHGFTQRCFMSLLSYMSLSRHCMQ